MVTPIVQAGASDLEQLAQCIEQMGGLCESQLANAVEAVARRDNTLAQSVIDGDERVDEIEQAVDEAAARFIAARQPKGADLRLTLSVMKIASDLERIGDLAKNISKRALVVNREKPLRLRLSQGLQRMGHQAVIQVKDVLDAFSERDAERAMAVWRRDEDVDEMYNSLFREFLTYMMEDPRTIGLCTHLLFVAKNLERVGDHATNIAEIIYYFDRGAYVSGERPKGDLTSLTSVSFGSMPSPSGSSWPDGGSSDQH